MEYWCKFGSLGNSSTTSRHSDLERPVGQAAVRPSVFFVLDVLL